MYYPSKRVVIWLQIGMIMVLLMVVIGGITRLTQSGLSMVHWKPLHFLPPLNETQWQEEFAAYQTSPEFQHFNHHFSVEDFKKIYFWEYLHRLIGRMLGLVFLVPFVWFYYTKQLESKPLRFQLWILFIWGGLQGFLGWYMVKSGLVDRPHVSHFRLAIHLITAFTMVSYMYYVILSLKYPLTHTQSHRSTRIVAWLYGIVLLQIVFGAFTAGLKAGFVYNTYPLMQNQFLPTDGITAFQSDGFSSVIVTHAWVQFIHRWWGLAVVFFVGIAYFYVKKNTPERNSKGTKEMLGLVIFQFLVGILTLVLHVPIVLAVVHQLVAALLLLSLVKVMYFSRATLH